MNSTLDEDGKNVEHAHALFNEGKQALLRADYESANEHFELAKVEYERLGHPDMVCSCNKNIGEYYSSINRVDKAVEYYQKAKKKYEELNDFPQVADIDLVIGQLYEILMHQPAHAIPYYLEARNRFEDLHDFSKSARCNRCIGHCYGELSQSDQAVEYFQEAQKTCEVINDIQQVSCIDGEIARFLNKNHKDKEAKEFLLARHDWYERQRRTEQIALCDQEIGHYFNNTYRPAEAIPHHTEALKKYEELHDSQLVAQCNESIASCYGVLRQTDKAVEHYQKAQENHEVINNFQQAAECNMSIGLLYGNLQQADKVVEYFRKAQIYYEKLGDIRRGAGIDNQIGRYFQNNNRPTEAIPHFTEAQRKYNELSDFQQEAQCNINIGECYGQLHLADQAIEYLQKAQNHYEELGDIRQLAQCNTSIGRNYGDRLHETGKAIEYLQRAQQQFAEIHDTRQLAQCSLLIGSYYAEIRQVNKAAEYFYEAQKKYEELNDNVQLAQLDDRIGHLYRNNGRHEEAIKSHSKARERFENLGDIHQLARCDSYLGLSYHVGHSYQEAMQHYLLASKESIQFYLSTFNKARKLSIFKHCAACHQSIASIYSKQGYYAKAIHWFLLAIIGHQIAENKNEARYCRILKNKLLKEQTIWVSDTVDTVDFSDWEEKVNVVIAKDKEGFIKAHCAWITALDYQEQGKYHEAFVLLEKAAPKLAQIQDNPKQFLSLAQMATTFGINETREKEAAKHFNEAVEYFLAAMEQYQAMRDTVATNPNNCILSLSEIEDGFILCGLGLASLSNFLGDEHEYLEIINCLKNDYGQGRVVDSWRNFAIQGKEMRLNGKTKKAMHFYEQAISEADSFWREELGRFSKTSEYRTKFLEENYDIYLDMVQLCLQRNEPATALEYLERITNKLLTEQLFHSSDKQHVSWSELHATIADRYDTCLIWLVPLEDRILIFLAQAQYGEEPLVITIGNYNRMKLWQDIKLLQQDKTDAEIEKSLIKELPDVCSRLYQELFVPIKEKLTSTIKQLIIVPYGGFRLLPLHALSYKENGKNHYLVDDYTVQYAPSALAYMQAIKPLPQSLINRLSGSVVTLFKMLKIIDRKESALVSFADPDNDLDQSVFATVSENLAKYFHTHKLNAATPDHLTRAINSTKWSRKITCFHSTSHADESGLRLHDDQDEKKPTVFSKEDIALLDLHNISQVVLSACKTGKTTLSIIDQDVSLAAAFLAGGAKTVIASLWPVPTALTTKLTEKMYEFLTEGEMTKPEALRQAQLWMRDLAGQEKNDVMEFVKNFGVGQQGKPSKVSSEENPLDPAHPYNWAGFYCTGDDGRMVEVYNGHC